MIMDGGKCGRELAGTVKKLRIWEFGSADDI